jgi:hypothetical protein
MMSRQCSQPSDSCADAFVEFRKHPAYSLRHLVLSDCFGLSDDGVAHIAAGCPNLEAINLSFCSRMPHGPCRRAMCSEHWTA